MSITGNDNGSFYCSSAKAKEAISDAMWDEEIVDLIRELGYDGIPTDKGPEAVDVIIRYVLIGEVYSELEDYFDENKPSIDAVIDSMNHWLTYDKDIKTQEYPLLYESIKTWCEMLEKVQEAM